MKRPPLLRTTEEVKIKLDLLEVCHNLPFLFFLFIYFLFAVHYLCTALKKIKHTCSIGMQSLITMESKEWRSGESAGLPSMWPGFKYQRRMPCVG